MTNPETHQSEARLTLSSSEFLSILNESHQSYANSLLYTYRKPDNPASTPDGYHPFDIQPRTVRPFPDGIGKIGFILDEDGSLRIAGREYTELSQNTKSIPETELSELLEALGYKIEQSGIPPDDPSKKYLTNTVLGDLAPLAEIGDMMNIASYTSLALENPNTMNCHKSFSSNESNKGHIAKLLELLSDPSSIRFADGQTLHDILPDSLQRLFDSCSSDQERIYMLLYIAQAKMWATSDQRNIRHGDEQKMRKDNPAVKLAILLFEQQLMDEYLRGFLSQDFLLRDEVKQQLMAILNESQQKRQKVLEYIQSQFLSSSQEGADVSQSDDYVHCKILPQLRILDDGQSDFLGRLNDVVRSLGSSAS